MVLSATCVSVASERFFFFFLFNKAGIFHIGKGWGGVTLKTWSEFQSFTCCALQRLAGDAPMQTAGAVFLYDCLSHVTMKLFPANIPVLINCFRGVTCILSMAVGLFQINAVILKVYTNVLPTLHCFKHEGVVVYYNSCHVDFGVI